MEKIFYLVYFPIFTSRCKLLKAYEFTAQQSNSDHKTFAKARDLLIQEPDKSSWLQYSNTKPGHTDCKAIVPLNEAAAWPQFKMIWLEHSSSFLTPKPKV